MFSEQDYIHELYNLKTELKEIRTALLGIDNKNGLRGELRKYIEENKERLDKLEKLIEDAYEWQSKIEQRFTNYLYKERKETCYGKELYNELHDELEKQKSIIEKEETENKQFIIEMEKSKVALKQATYTQLIATGGVILVTLINIFGPLLFKR